MKDALEAVTKHHKQNRQRTYNATLRRVHATTVAVGKTVSITYSVCVSIDLSTCKAHAPCYMSPTAWLAVPQFSTLSHKRHDFRKSY
jgi:hypothetical protein